MKSTLVKAIRHPDGSYGCVDEIQIHAPREQVFEVLRDFNGRARWGPNKARILGPEPLAEMGSHIELALGRDTLRMEVVNIKPPEFMTLKVTDGPFVGECEWQVLPGAGGSKARLIWKAIYPKSLGLKALFIFTGPLMHSRAAGRLLQALKKRLE